MGNKLIIEGTHYTTEQLLSEEAITSAANYSSASTVTINVSPEADHIISDCQISTVNVYAGILNATVHKT